MLKVAIIGTGGMGKTHCACFMRNKNCKVMAVLSRDKIKGKKFADGRWEDVVYAEEILGDFFPLYKIEKVYTNINDLAKDKNIDAVAVTSPPALHLAQAEVLMKSGKHLLIEKPLTLTAAEAIKIKLLAKKNKVKVMVAQTWRFHPEIIYLKKIINDGVLGKIVKIKSYAIHTLWAPPGWFRNKKIAGGGCLLDMGIHAIDTVRFLLNDVKAKNIFAQINTFFGDYDVDDSASLMLEFNNGTTAYIESGWNYPYAEGGEAFTYILGTKGFGRIFPLQLKIKTNNEWGMFIPSGFQNIKNKQVYQSEINNFVDVLLNNKPVEVTVASAIENAKIIDAAYKSAKEKKAITLNSQ